MFCNGRPSRNRRYVPNVRYILDRLTKQEVEMKKQDRKVGVWKGEELKRLLEEGDMTIQGDTEIFEEMGKEDSQEVYKDDLTYEGHSCPNCEVDTQIHNGVEECPVCGYIIKDI